MASVAIQDWGISVLDLTWMVHDDNLSSEEFSVCCWDVLSIRCDVTSLDISNSKTFNVETNIVSWDSFLDLLMMHFDGFALSSSSKRSESNSHCWLDDTSLDSTDWDSSNTGDLVNILKWESQWFKYWSLWWLDLIKSIHEAWSLIPRHVGGGFKHVVTNPS